MAIDLFRGHRNRPLYCEYWKRKETPDWAELVHGTKPDGAFYARPENSHATGEQELGGFQFDRDTITISTYDGVDVSRNDLVSFGGRDWLVVSVQRRESWGRGSIDCKVETVLELRS